jgi:hypothetical protein
MSALLLLLLLRRHQVYQQDDQIRVQQRALYQADYKIAEQKAEIENLKVTVASTAEAYAQVLSTVRTSSSLT